MQRALFGLLVSGALVFAASAAEARGCIRGALVGGVAGHYVHHPLLGALAGCVAGRTVANHPPRLPAPLGRSNAVGAPEPAIVNQ